MADAPARDRPAGGGAGGGGAGGGGAGGDGAAPGADRHAAVVDELRARFGDAPSGPAVAIYLAARGYDPTQVAAVLARLDGSAPPGAGVPDDPAAPGVQSAGGTAGGTAGAAPGAPPAEPAPRPLRAWAPHERARFSAEAWGRLLRLRADGLGDHEFEHLVDRALLQLDGPVTLPELRALLGDALGPGDAAPPPLH